MFVFHALLGNIVLQVQDKPMKMFVFHALLGNIALQVQDKSMKIFVSHALQANTVFQVQVRSSKQYVSYALEVNIVLQVQDKQMQMFVFHALRADTETKKANQAIHVQIALSVDFPIQKVPMNVHLADGDIMQMKQTEPDALVVQKVKI